MVVPLLVFWLLSLAVPANETLAVSLTRSRGPVQRVTQKANARIRGVDRW